MMMRRLYWLIATGLLIVGAGRLLAQTEIKCDKPTIADATPSYYIGLGKVAFDASRFGDAVRLYTCGIDLQPNYAPAYVDRGYAYAALADSDSALADYKKALELDDKLVSAYNNRGALYTRLGNFGLAINDFTLVISLDPNNAVAYNNRGVVHAAEKNYDLAIADFQQAIKLDPNYTTPYASLGAVYSALAASNYQTFVKVGGNKAKLPAGTPTEVLQAIDDSLRDGNFAVWVSLLTPAR
jgi:tetratricopeptide (TPR) repeat protein